MKNKQNTYDFMDLREYKSYSYFASFSMKFARKERFVVSKYEAVNSFRCPTYIQKPSLALGVSIFVAKCSHLHSKQVENE